MQDFPDKQTDSFVIALAAYLGSENPDHTKNKQEILAKNVGVSQATISRIASGKVKGRMSTREKIAEKIGKTYEEMIIEGWQLKTKKEIFEPKEAELRREIELLKMRVEILEKDKLDMLKLLLEKAKTDPFDHRAVKNSE